MANLSNRNTQSNTTNNTTAERPLFKAGDAVLCPSLGNTVFTLQSNNDDGCSVIIRIGDSAYRFFNDGRKFPENLLPDLFHDTPENRQYIAGLYGAGMVPNVITTPKSPLNRKVIDLTQDDDNEVIVLSAFELSNIACEVLGAYETLEDLKQLLYIIFNRQLTPTQEVSLTRLSYEACETWVNIMNSLLTKLNKPLAQTSVGIVGGK